MTGLAWKRRLGRWFGPLTERANRRVILLYHAIDKGAPAVTVTAFREQLDWLFANATIAPLDDLLLPGAIKGLEVALSFDDGYSSLHDIAMPLLAERGACATVYLTTGEIGERHRRPSDPKAGHYPGQQFLTWRDVKALARAGWTIGSHGVKHLDLTGVSSAAAHDQLEQSRQEIERRLEMDCRHFAYTWGRFSTSLQQLVAEAGFETAVSGLHGPITNASPRLALPRIDVRAEYQLSDFVAAVTGRWDYLGMRQRLARNMT